jgi:hypothetical protein
MLDDTKVKRKIQDEAIGRTAVKKDGTNDGQDDATKGVVNTRSGY